MGISKQDEVKVKIFCNILKLFKGKVRSRKSLSQLEDFFLRSSKITAILSSLLCISDKSASKLPIFTTFVVRKTPSWILRHCDVAIVKLSSALCPC